MAGTRTVYRGSRGRFAGSSGGKAERVRVSRRSARPASPAGTKVSKGAKAPSRPVVRAHTPSRFNKKSLAQKAVTIGVTAGAAAVAHNVVRGGGFGRGGLIVGGRKGPKKPTLGENRSGASTLNGVLRLPDGSRIPHNINFNNPPTRNNNGPGNTRAKPIVMGPGPIGRAAMRTGVPMPSGPIGKAASAANARPQPNYSAAKGMKENLRIREVPLKMGTINGKKIR